MSGYASWLLTSAAAAACAVVLSAGVAPSEQGANANAKGKDIAITVREGTSMAIALSPDKTRVAIDLQGGLWVVPIGGGAAKRITDEYGDARQPSWSPDGKTIAFQSYRDGTWRIWTVGADGSGLTAITSGPFDDREPHWSPDGARVAFSSDRSGNYDIWILERATGAVRQVTTDPGNDFCPSWSADGRQIAFVSTRVAAPGVYAIAVEGATAGAERLIAGSKGSVGTPSWSPDGKVLFSVGPATGAAPIAHARQLIYDGRLMASGEDYFPFRAAWISGDEFLYPADGLIKRRSLSRGEQPPVDFTATLTVKPPVYARKPRDFDAATERRALGVMRPVVSPDRKRLAFAALGDIWTVDIAAAGRASAPVRVTDDAFVDTDPAWSPDGTRLAFTSDRAGGMDIWVRDLATREDRRLTSLPDADMAPAWSPDGRFIAFVSNQAYEQGELYVVSAVGGEPRKLHDRIFGVGYPSWSADGTFIVTSAVKPYSARFRESMNYYWIVPVAATSAAARSAGQSPAIARPEMILPEEHTPIGKRAGDGPAISPDGRTLAYVSNGFLYVRPIDASGRPAGPARQITRELSDAISWAGAADILYMSADRVKLVSVATGTTRDVPINLTWRPAIAAGRKVVHAGRLIDGVSPTARESIDIVIDGQRIAAIEQHRDALHAGATVVDASEQSVMPGLIEGHGHTLKEHGDLFGRVHLAYGVTGFRDVGGIPYDVLESKEAIASGRRVGPTVFTTGYLLDGRRPYYPMATTAPDETVVDLELERARRLDYDMLKTYVRLPDLLQKRAIDGAHRLGIPTSSHEIYPAALSGGDSVEHTGATSRRGYSTKQSGMGRAYEDVIQIITKSGMTITPTLALGGFQAAIADTPAILDDPRWRLLQPPWSDAAVRARAATPRAGGVTEGQRTVLALHRAGARLIAGVDSPLTPYGTALHTELSDYVAAGLTPFEALKTATINPATLIGVARDLGTIEVGKLADLVVVDGNPLVNIADTRRVRQVVKHGEVYSVEQLLKPAPPSKPMPTTPVLGGPASR